MAILRVRGIERVRLHFDLTMLAGWGWQSVGRALFSIRRMRLALILSTILALTACGSSTHERSLSLREVTAAVRNAGFTQIRVASATQAIKFYSGFPAKGIALGALRTNTPDYLWFGGPHGSPYLVLRRFVSVQSAKKHPAVSSFAPIRICNVEIDDLAHAAPTQRQANRVASEASARIASQLRGLCRRN